MLGGQVFKLDESPIEEDGTVLKLFRKYEELMGELSQCGDADLLMYEAKKVNEVTLNILINEYKAWCNEDTINWIEKCKKG